MATEIGSSTASTWATCRTAIGNGGSGLSGGGSHNQVWTYGFRTTEGNGFVRCDYYAKLAFAACYVVYDDFSFLFYLSNATNYIVMDQAEADKLIGETVTLTGPDTFTITSDYLTASGQSVTTTGFSPITSIGLLTAF